MNEWTNVVCININARYLVSFPCSIRTTIPCIKQYRIYITGAVYRSSALSSTCHFLCTSNTLFRNLWELLICRNQTTGINAKQYHHDVKWFHNKHTKCQHTHTEYSVSTRNAETEKVEKLIVLAKKAWICRPSRKICCRPFFRRKKEFGGDLNDFWKIRGRPHIFMLTLNTFENHSGHY